ncbi:MAG: hypothetical protein IKP67_08960 [Spirochaetales bacterium]|nr:hypothetical protein [Spirochaetales bacterium]
MPEAFAIYETLSPAEQKEILDFIYFIAARAKKQKLEEEEESMRRLREASLSTVWESVKNDTW